MKHIIKIEAEHRDDKGNSTGVIYHVVTLSNKAAFDIVLDYILNLDWLDCLKLSLEDICPWDGE